MTLASSVPNGLEPEDTEIRAVSFSRRVLCRVMELQSFEDPGLSQEVKNGWLNTLRNVLIKLC
jgi:hypothetical protein